MICSTRLSKERDGKAGNTTMMGEWWSSEGENVNCTLVLTGDGRGGGRTHDERFRQPSPICFERQLSME
jgi:hypothetical protein